MWSFCRGWGMFLFVYRVGVGNRLFIVRVYLFRLGISFNVFWNVCLFLEVVFWRWRGSVYEFVGLTFFEVSLRRRLVWVVVRVFVCVGANFKLCVCDMFGFVCVWEFACLWRNIWVWCVFGIRLEWFYYCCEFFFWVGLFVGIFTVVAGFLGFL